MKILYFTSPAADYLSDSLFHGMRSLFGDDCIDYPKCEIMYKNYPSIIRPQVYGRGFTLYTGLLDDLEIDRYNIEEKISRGYFSLIVFSDIQRQFGYFVRYRPWLTAKNTIIVDGADTTQPYPATGFWWRRPYYWFLPRAHKEFLYFKREWTPDTSFSLTRRYSPKILQRMLPQSNSLRRISFGIPQEKILVNAPNKIKDFPKHIIDPDVSKIVEGSLTSYAFETEADYYKDIQQSRFGITTKRAGWDCMRHYEIAANGAVPCFKDLYLKGVNCAPHGLSNINSITYINSKQLLERIGTMDNTEYSELQAFVMKWVRQKTTINQAKEVVGSFRHQN
jgi:hypothetical protein